MAHSYRDDDEVRKIPRISWGAVFAGGIAALAISILLNLLGLGLGFTAIDPLSESQPLSGLGTGTIIWWIVSNLIALFLGGMVAGRTAGFISKTDGGLHGFLSWCLYAAVCLFFITSLVGSIISGVSGTVSSIFGGGQQQEIVVRVDGQQQQAQNQQGPTFENLRSQVIQLINQAEQYGILPSGASEDVNQALDEGIAQMSEMWQELDLDQNIDEFLNDLSVEFENGNLSISVEGEDYINREEITNYLAQNTDLSEQEIEQMINEWNKNIEQAINEVEKLYQEAKQKVEEFSDQLADTIATISLISFFALILGAVAAWGGGMMAAKLNPDLIEGDRPERI